jgi:predicted transcriptional regulator
MAGFVKLHRAVRGTAIAQHPEYFAAWVHILCMATHKTRQQVVGTKIVDLEPGDLVFGRLKFSATTGISENKVRSALKVMEGLGMITSKSHSKFSVISITNWTKYQDQSPANNQQTTSKPPASNHEQECIKNGLRMSKDKDSMPAKAVTPALDYSSWPDLPDEQILKDWIAARKKAKASNSQTAINTIGKQLHKAVEKGYTVNECAEEAIMKTWRGFKAEWMDNAKGGVNAKGYGRIGQVDYNTDGWADGFDPNQDIADYLINGDGSGNN